MAGPSYSSSRPTTANSQGSTFRKPVPPTYEQILALLSDARSELETTYAHVTSVRNQDPTTPKSSQSLTNVLLRNLRDSQDDCNLRALSPQDILDTRIERERDLIDFWNQSSRIAEGKDAVNEDIENFPLQAAALDAGIVYRPPQFLGVPKMAEEQAPSRGRGNVISNPKMNASVQLPHPLSAYPLSGAGLAAQLRGVTQCSTPSRGTFEQSLFQHSPFSPYNLSEVPATEVVPSVDERELARYNARTSAEPREKVQQKRHNWYEKSSDNSGWNKYVHVLSVPPTRVQQTGHAVDSPMLRSPMTPGVFSADGNEDYTSGYVNSSIQWSPENFSPVTGGDQNSSPVQQAQGQDQFQSGYLPSPRTPYQVQQQMISVPQKRKKTASATQDYPAVSQPETLKKLKGAQPLVKSGVVGKQLNDFPSPNIPFPAVVQGRPLDVTIVELLTFFPRYIFSSEVVERIVSNGGSQNLIAKIMNANLRLSAPMEDNFLLHVLQARMRHKGDRTANGGYDYTKWTVGRHQPLANHDPDKLDIAGLRTRFDIENFPSFRDANSIPFKKLAERVKAWPSGRDALNLTHCVRYASLHPEENWNYPADFRDMITYLTNGLAGVVTFPVPVTDQHLDRAAWERWRNT
ncbi:hypothetical protein DPSP01_014125 [Paraphaeosphaeria sporulosa]